MINNPDLINKMIEKIKTITKEDMDKVIAEIEKEQQETGYKIEIVKENKE